MSGSGPAREYNRSRMAEAALNNESLTRQRVEWLEVLFKQYTADLKDIEERTQPLCRDFWGRMRWLLLGR